MALLHENGFPSIPADAPVKRALKADVLSGLNDAVLDLLPVAVYFCDQDAVLTRWNRQAVELWGREPKAGDPAERFCGSYKLYRADGSFMAHCDCPVADALRTGQPQRNIEAIIERPDGSRRFILANMDALRDETGAVVGVVNVLQDISHQKQAEEALRQSERRFRRLLDDLPAASYTCDAQGLITYFNERAVALWGREPRLNDPTDRYCGSFRLFLPNGTPIRHEECWLAQALREDRSFSGQEIVVERPDGGRHHVLAHANPFHDEAERVAGAVNVLMDITPLKQTETSLRESEERLRAVFQQTQAGIAQTDLSGRFVLVNQRYCEIVGRTLEELLGLRMQDITHPDDLPGNLKLFELAVREGVPFEIEKRYVRPDGTPVWVSNNVSLVATADGRPSGILAVAVDISERIALQQQAEAALRESEAYFRELTQNMPIVVWTSLPDGRVDFVNQRWLEMTGQTLDYVQSHAEAWMIALHPEDRERAGTIYLEGIRAAEGFTMEARFRRAADGEYRWHLNRCVPLRDGAGKSFKFLGTCTDIEDQKRLEAQLRQADRRKDEFLAQLAHELRNPLAPLRNGLEVMRLAGNDRETLDRIRTVMDRQLQQMVRLVDDLLDLSRITRGTIELRKSRVELREVVQSALETSRPLIEAAGHRLTVTFAPSPIFLEADPTRLAQVFSNLLNNAAKYSDVGGYIQVIAEREGACAVIRVRDDGIGIPADMLDGIFEMFRQVDRSLEKRHGGLGIGLTLVRQLVEMHGGTVEARSEGPGQGSEFIVRLPAVTDLDNARYSSSEGEPGALSAKCRLLVADDNADAAETLAMMLALSGNEVRTARDGQEALETAAVFRPDLVILDIGMPGLNGYEAARRIREQPWGRNIILVALTGWGQPEDKQQAMDAGFDHHLTKPVDPAALDKLLAGLAATSA